MEGGYSAGPNDRKGIQNSPPAPRPAPPPPRPSAQRNARHTTQFPYES